MAAATRWGCLGPGKIASDFFLAIQDNLPASEHEFVAVASRDLERAQTFADKFKFKKAYGSYDEVASDPDVEVVYIATLHISHVELSIKMLEAGKHVLCEKPMTVHYKQIEKVFAVAKAHNRLFVEAMWSRHFPVYKQILKEIEDGTLGEVRLVQANLSTCIADTPRLKTRELGGGGLYDVGIYVVQFACHVFREMPEEITVVGNKLGDTGVDRDGCIIFKYKNGAMASLSYSIDMVETSNTACIIGTKGGIKLSPPFHCAVSCSTPSGDYNFPLKPNNYCWTNDAGLHYQVASFRECLLKGLTESPVVSQEVSLLVHRCLSIVAEKIGTFYPGGDDE